MSENIKKFRNGKVKLYVPENDWCYRDDDGKVKEEFYFDEMELADLRIEVIEGDWYIIDFNTGRVYNYFNGYLIQNPLKYLLDDLTKNKKIYLYPLSNRESKELIEKYFSEVLG